MGMYDLFLCLEMEGLYHIYQQFSELLACNFLDDEVMFLVILERKVYFLRFFLVLVISLVISITLPHAIMC